MPLFHERMKFLDPQNNCALKHFEIKTLLAYKNKRVVGRITAHIDRAYNRYHGTDKTGWFGFFECINDPKSLTHSWQKQATGYDRKAVKKSSDP